MEITIRPATEEDILAIAEIYNHAIQEGNATFDSFLVSSDRYAELLRRKDAALLVAEKQKQVVGWTSVSPISERWAYRVTSLGSFFVHRDFRREGIGTALKQAQISEAARLGYHSLIVEVLSTNPLSISMNLRNGFRIVGETWEAGFRDGTWIGLVTMQKLLNAK